MVKQKSDNEIYLLIKYIKSVLWRVAKRQSYIEDVQCLKVKYTVSISAVVLCLLDRFVQFSMVYNLETAYCS